MAIVTIQPAANQTPDATLGGLAVTGASNTGHSSTTANAAAGGSQTKSCRWFTFPAVSGQFTSVTLKIDHTTSGLLIGPSPTNDFLLQYTVNGGGAWLSAVARSNFTSAQGPTTFSVALSTTQDTTQVQVRDLLDVNAPDLTDQSQCTATIANIKLEIDVVTGYKPIWVG